MQKCKQMATTEHAVTSSSSTKKYRVRAFLPDGEPPTCDCTAFAISRNRDGGKNHGGKGWCKHITYVYDNTCSWQEGVSAERQKINGICPVCGGPTVTGEITALPESPVKAAELAAERLLALAADLAARTDG
jgi:hypothetical protein